MAEPMDIDQDELVLSDAGAFQAVADSSANSSLLATEDVCHSFTPFPRLPLEIRDIIWGLAVPRFRTFNVEEQSALRVRLDPMSRAAAVPAILRANKESRRVALLMLDPFAGKWGKPVYFNFKTDVLRVRGVRALAALCGAGLSINLKKHFPLDVREWHVKLRHIEITEVGSRFDTAAFQWMKSLKTLAVEDWRAITLQEKEMSQERLRSELAKHWLGPANMLPEITVFTSMV
ncbi:hypothetical protein BKA64DRAFT_408980 [Cadophora sp. MPI-SDFR-AT-0126]|nr:hypothetical protein BKA64DRAFT_408980 [Leotiomycetes sp. MPI-SDFR-AT-0126]